MPKRSAKVPKIDKGNLASKNGKKKKERKTNVPFSRRAGARGVSEPLPSTSKLSFEGEKEAPDKSGANQGALAVASTSFCGIITTESSSSVETDNKEMGDRSSKHEILTMNASLRALGIIVFDEDSPNKDTDSGKGSISSKHLKLRPMRRSARLLRRRLQRSGPSTSAAYQEQEKELVGNFAQYLYLNSPIQGPKQRRPSTVEELLKEFCEKLAAQLVIYVNPIPDAVERVQKELQLIEDSIAGRVNPDQAETSDEDNNIEVPVLKLFSSNEWVYTTPPRGRKTVPEIELSNSLCPAIITKTGETKTIYEIDPDTVIDLRCVERIIQLDSDCLRHVATIERQQVHRQISVDVHRELRSALHRELTGLHQLVDVSVQYELPDVHRIVRADLHRGPPAEEHCEAPVDREIPHDANQVFADLPSEIPTEACQEVPAHMHYEGLAAINRELPANIHRLIRANVQRVLHREEQGQGEQFDEQMIERFNSNIDDFELF